MCPLLRLTANDICQAQCPYLPHFWELLCHYYAAILQQQQKNPTYYAVILSLPCYKTSMFERMIQKLGDAVAATRPSEGTGEPTVRKAT